jgi:toxin-antitoxin system PIN domain toxin
LLVAGRVRHGAGHDGKAGSAQSENALVLAVDTNVLVYAADADSPFHVPCRGWLERRRTQSGAWYATWPILYEFLRVTTHPRVMRRPWNLSQAWDFVTALLASPGFSVLAATQRHADVAAEVFAELPHLAGNLIHDTHTAVLMREHGIKLICTRDTDFSRFPFIEIVDPLRA